MDLRERYVYPYGLRSAELARVVPAMARIMVETYRNPQRNADDRELAAAKLAYVTEMMFGFENLQSELVANLAAVDADPIGAQIYARMASDPVIYDRLIPIELKNGNDHKLLRSILDEQL